MLKLTSQTERAWAEHALQHVDELLLDHAHCEKRAAGMAIGLISRYADRPELLEEFSKLAREELSHFELLLGVLREKKIDYRHQEPSPYPAKLLRVARTREPGRLVDTLLCCACIEARSCERFKLLSEVTTDPLLQKLYGGLLAAEARHHRLYVDLAAQVAPRQEVDARLAEILLHEAKVLAEGTPLLRLHS